MNVYLLQLCILFAQKVKISIKIMEFLKKRPKYVIFSLIIFASKRHKTSAKLRHILAEAEVKKWPKLAGAEASVVS